MKHTPLRSKRPTARVKRPERVAYVRTKPKRGAEPTAEQQRYHDWLRALGRCEACGGRIDLVIHHILPSYARDHWNVVLICAPCHNGRADSVHLLGSEAKFRAVHGVDLSAIAARRLREWQSLGRL